MQPPSTGTWKSIYMRLLYIASDDDGIDLYAFDSTLDLEGNGLSKFR